LGDRGSRRLSASPSTPSRPTWGTRTGFLLAAAGSAVGLGNLWRFPYLAGENGGGWFVVLYLACLAGIGLPILIAEIALGRATRASPVVALRKVAGPATRWAGLGWLGITAVILALAVYAVVAGWTLHFAALAFSGSAAGTSRAEAAALFGAIHADFGRTFFWAMVFLTSTAAIVQRGVRRGIERWSRILLPLLVLLLLLLLAKSLTLDGARDGLRFAFGLHAGRLSASSVLDAMGQAFFTLGVGVGGLLTYGSYLQKEANIVSDSLTIIALDTAVSLVACGVIFPITFTYGLAPAEGPGLVFVTLPIAFTNMPGAAPLAAAFFLLLAFAALTSAINMLELPTAHFIDARGWTRRRATLTMSGLVALLAIPVALAGSSELFGDGMRAAVGSDALSLAMDTVSNWMMPLGGLGFAIFVGWRLPEALRRRQFPSGLVGALYAGWLATLRWLVPAAIVLILLRAIGVL
jgi:neurotransmitter:Na+ symporter, NSS family